MEKDFLTEMANFGFPVILSWYLLLRMEQKLDKLTESINLLSKQLDKV